MTGITDLDREHLDWPYFVYGTLRPRCGNSSWWRETGAVALFDGEVIAPGFKMICRSIPFAVPSGDDDFVVGALIMPSDDYGEMLGLRFNLDRLEGHPSHYERVEADVETPLGTCVAWIYRYNHTPTGQWVKSGDYYLVQEVNR